MADDLVGSRLLLGLLSLDHGEDALANGELLDLTLVVVDSKDLVTSNGTEEEVDWGQEVVLGLDDETPAGPNDTGGQEGKLLSAGHGFDGALDVGDTSKHERPLKKKKEKGKLAG